MKFNRVLALALCASISSSALVAHVTNVGSVCEKEGVCEKIKGKCWDFKNCTDQLLSLEVQCPQRGSVSAVLPIRDLQNPNFFAAGFKYANMEDPMISIKHKGHCLPFTVFRTQIKDQHKAQVVPGHYKIMTHPHKVGFHLLLVDEAINMEDIKDKL